MLAAFEELAAGFTEISDQVKELAALTRSSPALNAWTLHIYVGYEDAIAALVSRRLPDPRSDDPRPRLIGARRWRRFASHSTTGCSMAGTCPSGSIAP